ncbi:MAG TPA: hypothetical protein VG122_19655, partial [Gemmata sp.]|nr:hypothetical protein [Gemmata sp.]
MPSFKVPCLSCEHPVLIKDPKLIGTKVECPKCKYRFKVEEPAGGIPTEDAKSSKGKKPADDGDDGGKKKKKSKKVVAIVVGVLAVGVLAAVGFAVMGGGDKPKPTVNAPKGGGGSTGNTINPIQDPTDDPNKKDTPKEPIRKNTLPMSEKEPSNLLPGQTVSLYRFDLEKLRQTPINTLFDPLMLGMFKDSFGFDAEDVALYYHAFVGNTRDPFDVIRLKEPTVEKDVLSKMALGEESKKVKGRTLYTFKKNPFINGIANAFSLGSLFSDVYEKVPRGP